MLGVSYEVWSDPDAMFGRYDDRQTAEDVAARWAEMLGRAVTIVRVERDAIGLVHAPVKVPV